VSTGIQWLDEKATEAKKRLQDKQGQVVEHIHEKAQSSPTVYGFEGEINMSRILVKAAHGLNLSQKRLIMYAVSKIHPHVPQPNQIIVKVNALEYAQKMEVHAPNAYRDLQDAADNLFHRYISISYETPKGREIEKIHWVSSAKYHTGEGWVELRFSPEVSPYLSMLNEGNQINYNLQLAVDLRSVYAWRLLELLMQWKDTKRLYIRLDDFRHALEVPETYRYADIRINCLEKPILELREKARIEVTWKAVKDKENRRKVGMLEFTWKAVEQLTIKLEGAEQPKPSKSRKSAAGN